VSGFQFVKVERLGFLPFARDEDGWLAFPKRGAALETGVTGHGGAGFVEFRR
jgi:hypothetical protein